MDSKEVARTREIIINSVDTAALYGKDRLTVTRISRAIAEWHMKEVLAVLDEIESLEGTVRFSKGWDPVAEKIAEIRKRYGGGS